MLDKSADTPRGRVLALFDIMADWATAPGIHPRTPDTLMGNEDALISYLTRELNALNLQEPEILANQIYFIAMGALQASSVPEQGNVFAQARQAAAILLDAHRPPRRIKSAATVFATAALVLASALLLFPLQEQAINAGNLASLQPSAGIESLHYASTSASPDQVASLTDALERIRRGVCQYPQALMLEPGARAVLLENVVNGSIPADAASLREAHRLTQTVECYYAPTAMTAL